MRILGNKTRAARSRRSWSPTLLVALVLVFLLATAALADFAGWPLVRTGGKTIGGELIAADAEGRLTFRVSDRTNVKPEIVPAAQLVRWGRFVESSRGPQILLADGSLLVAEITALNQQQLTAESELFGKVSLPLSAVAAIVIQPPADPLRRDQLLAGLLADQTGDQVLLANGDRLPGKVTAWRAGKITVESDAGPVELDLAQLTAIQLPPRPAADRDAQGLTLIVGWRDGSRLAAKSLVTEAKIARLTLATAAVTLSADTAAISGLQTLGGQAVYLSELTPAGYKHIPFLQLAWPYQADKNVSGDLLRAGGRLYLKGLGMHSASRLTYDLDHPASRLEASLAVDDRAAGRGSVVFRVFVDTGDGRWEPKFTSPTLRGGDPPLPISVDVAGAKRISLLVEFADRGDQLDYADWLDVRLIP